MSTPTLTPVTQDLFLADIATLAALVSADRDWRPGFLIGIGRGGLVPGTYLSHAVGVPLLSVDYSSEVPDFADGLLVKLAAMTQTGQRILLIDDINDSGRTIGQLRAKLHAAGGLPEAIRFAVLIDNLVSQQRVDYFARTIDRTVVKDWFVFPWEAVSPKAQLVDDAFAVPERLG
jgi:hypoxanthine phosphoribosyltransferase